MAKQATDLAHGRHPLFPHVTVILGDPHLAKPNRAEQDDPRSW
jgi:hypothetical protein